MVVDTAMLYIKLELNVQTLTPGSRPVQPSLTISTAVSWNLETTFTFLQTNKQSLNCSHSLITVEAL